MRNAGAKPVAAWLELALRHRQHRLDELAPELQAARDEERAGAEALGEARRRLDAAHAAQRQAAGAASLSLELLRLHGSHCARLRNGVDDAANAARAARQAADALRVQAARGLSERDAFQQRLDDQAQAARSEAARRAARHVDELWLLAGGASHPVSMPPSEGASNAD